MALSDYRTAVVTGASSGIGAALVERLAASGLEVHAMARDGERLAALAARTGAIAHPLDVADTPALERILGGLEVDVLVNNAGINRPTPLAETPAADIDRVLAVNLGAVLHAMRIVLPGMLARDRGHIVNIGSISGLHTFPGHAAYHASKAGVHALTGQIRLEVFGKRIRVTEVVPGRVATEIFARTSGDAEAARRTYLEGYETLQPADIVAAIFHALDAPAHVDVALLEILPTFQAVGGLQFHKRG